MYSKPTFLVLYTTILCIAQDKSAVPTKPNFSGSWKLVVEKSAFNGPRNALVYNNSLLVIDHNDPELKILRKLIESCIIQAASQIRNGMATLLLSRN